MIRTQYEPTTNATVQQSEIAFYYDDKTLIYTR